jgi:hypothetical protein
MNDVYNYHLQFGQPLPVTLLMQTQRVWTALVRIFSIEA